MKKQKESGKFQLVLAIAVVALGLVFSVGGVKADEDVTGPLLTAFSATPTSINTNSFSQTITATFTATDPSVFNYADSRCAIYGDNNNPSFEGDIVHSSGDTYTCAITLPIGSASGQWYFDLHLYDSLDNRANYDSNEEDNGNEILTAVPGATGSIITNTATIVDETGPSLTAFSATPTSVDTTSSSKTIVATFTATDPAGLDYSGSWCELNGNNDSQSIDGDIAHLSGNTYTCTITFPTGYASGQWYFYLRLYDNLDNGARYDAEENGNEILTAVSDATGTIISNNIISPPTASPSGGTYTSVQSVTLSSATSGATIHYTIDGSTPTSSSPAYSSALTVSSTTTLKAITTKSGMTDSSVMSELYTINLQTVAAPTASPAGGSYVSNQSVTLSTGTGGATIYYTTDGSTPNTSSPTYSSPLSITNTTTLKAIAIKSGMLDSGVMTQSYNVQVTTNTPTLPYSINKKIKTRISYTFKNLSLTNKKYVTMILGGRKVKVVGLGRSGADSVVTVEIKYAKWPRGSYNLVMRYKNQTKVAYIKKGKTKYKKGWQTGSVSQDGVLVIQ